METAHLASESNTLREQARAAIKSQRRSSMTVLSSLLSTQDKLGYLPMQAIEEVAINLNTTTNEVWGVASFYTNFRFTPPGKHIVEVCWGPTCHLANASHILNGLQEKLDLSDEGETANKKITLKYNTCLGACAQAPVISIDHQLSGRQSLNSSLEQISNLLDQES